MAGLACYPSRRAGGPIFRADPQRRGGGVICHHAIDGRLAVAAVLGPVGGIDARTQLCLAAADVLDGDIGLQARDTDARSP